MRLAVLISCLFFFATGITNTQITVAKAAELQAALMLPRTIILSISAELFLDALSSTVREIRLLIG